MKYTCVCVVLEVLVKTVVFIGFGVIYFFFIFGLLILILEYLKHIWFF